MIPNWLAFVLAAVTFIAGGRIGWRYGRRDLIKAMHQVNPVLTAAILDKMGERWR